MSVAKLEDQLCFALYSASSYITNVYRPLLDPLDLTYTQFVVLMALWQEDNISISNLAGTVGLSKATMTPLLKRLEQKQLIKREFLANNERQKNIKLTNKGWELSKLSGEVTDKVFCSTGLSQQKAQELMSLCNQITEQSNIKK